MFLFPAFKARPLDPAGLQPARELVLAAGAHGIYVANALAAGQGEMSLCWGEHGLLGCLWFGPRGNLVIIERQRLRPDAVADAVQNCRWPWRIVLGPGPAVDALAQRLTGPPLVHREQVYHGCAPAAAIRPPHQFVVRLAEPGDRRLLMAATLELNRTDLGVEPRRVDRRWLREMVDTRIRDGSALVHGEVGSLQTKLDLAAAGGRAS